MTRRSSRTDACPRVSTRGERQRVDGRALDEPENSPSNAASEDREGGAGEAWDTDILVGIKCPSENVPDTPEHGSPFHERRL